MPTEPSKGFDSEMFLRAAMRKIFPETLDVQGPIDLVAQEPYAVSHGPEWSVNPAQMATAGQEFLTTLGAGGSDLAETFRDMWAQRSAPELQRAGYLEPQTAKLRQVGGTPIGSINGVAIWALPGSALPGAAGQYDPASGTIQVPADPITEGISSTADIRWRVPAGTAAHEVQHAGVETAAPGKLFKNYTYPKQDPVKYRTQWQETMARGASENLTRPGELDRTGMDRIFEELQKVTMELQILPKAEPGSREFAQIQAQKVPLVKRQSELRDAYLAEEARARAEAFRGPAQIGPTEDYAQMAELFRTMYGRSIR